MPLHSLPEKDLRDHCRRVIEGLEIWLRRLIHDELSSVYGTGYLHATYPDGGNVVNNGIRTSILQRYDNNSTGRYSRPIDAALLEDEIAIISNPLLYKNHFKKGLEGAFPFGHDQARVVLQKLIEPRNCLAHGNVITVRRAEQVICYVGDIIESLKNYYVEANMASQYNAPRFVRVVDSLGNVGHFQGEPANVDTFYFPKNNSLHVGDTLSIQLEVDPSFPPSDYRIVWQAPAPGLGNGCQLALPIEERHITADLRFTCELISNNSWHRYGRHDHYLCFIYKVLPNR